MKIIFLFSLCFCFYFFLLFSSINAHQPPSRHDVNKYHLHGLTKNNQNHQLQGLRKSHSHQSYQLQLTKVTGPEAIAFDCNNTGPYTGVSDGRILKWQGEQLGWIEFATTAPNRPRELCDGSTNTTIEALCGRPLGIKFNPNTCDLYIADAYYGLMVVGPKGGLAQRLVSSAEGIPLTYTNALDIDPNTGVVYFTDSSLFFQRSQFLLPIITGDRTGRLLKYDPNAEQTKVKVMYRGLAYANGVALCKDSSCLLVAESSTNRIFRFWLHDQGETRNYYTPEFFAKVPSFPDNIQRTEKGEFWVALNIANENGNEPAGIKYDELGNIIDVLHGNALVSDIVEHDEKLYLGSSVQPYVGVTVTKV